jgi:hypothetical protein
LELSIQVDFPYWNLMLQPIKLRKAALVLETVPVV